MNRFIRPVPAILLFASFLLPGCNPTLLQFLVPITALGGSTIEVVVVGSQSGGSFGDQAGAVLQIPPRFAVLDAMTPNNDLGNPIPVVQNDPNLLSSYTAELGASLFAFSGSTTAPPSNPLVLRARLQVPSNPGVYVLKVALAGTTGGVWQATDPAGVTDFASITAAPYVQSIVVLGAPVAGAPSWVEDISGLPLYSSQGWGGSAFGDVNGDGREDLGCIARLGDGPHVFLRNPPSGWTESSAGLSVGTSGRTEVAFGDFDGDGLLDLASGNGTAHAYFGDGGNSWTPANSGLAPIDPEGVAAGDVNGDGFDDLAFSGHFSPRLQFYLSLGNGTWLESSAGLPTSIPPGAGIAGGHKLLMRDVNGDGFLDLVWTRFYAPGVWLGDGAGSWTEVASGLNPYNVYGIDGGDVDGDGDFDLVFGVVQAGSNGPPGGLRLFRQQPGPQWIEDLASGLPSTGTYFDVAVADFDRDGILDVAGGRAAGTNGGIEIWHGQLGGTFLPAPFSSGLPSQYIPNPEGIAVGDANDDTFPDIAVAAYGMGVSVYVNQLTGFSRYGSGCQGSSPFAPTMGSAGGPPTVGNASFAWTLAGAPPGAPCLLILGASKTFLGGSPILPLSLAPFGAPGCSLLAEFPVLVQTAASGLGTVSVTTPIPNSIPLLLRTFFGQWAVAVPGANPLGLIFSEGGAARIGP
jgi:hypothetical protein